jgi:hypothetical protein
MKPNAIPLRLYYHLPFWPPTGWYLVLFSLGVKLAAQNIRQSKYTSPILDGHMVGYNWRGLQQMTAEIWRSK